MIDQTIHGQPLAPHDDPKGIWREFRLLGWAVSYHQLSGTFEAKRLDEPSIGMAGKAASLAEIRDVLLEERSKDYEQLRRIVAEVEKRMVVRTLHGLSPATYPRWADE